MRAVIDTNVLFSALYDPDSVPGRLVELALEGALILYAPDTVRDELTGTLQDKLAYTDQEVAATLTALPVEWVEQAVYEEDLEHARGAISDPDDLPLVAVALLAGTGVISGDGAFHPMDRAVVPTWKPRETVEGLEAS